MKAGVARALLHAGTVVLLVPLLASWQALRATLLVVAFTALVLEGLRLTRPALRQWASRTVPVFRPHEATRPSGAAWLFAGYALAAWMPIPAPAAAVVVGALADPAAALVGGRFGRGQPKSWPGTIAAWGVATAALWLIGVAPPAAAAAGLATACLERWPGPFNDNLLIAPGVGLVVWWLG